MSLSTLTASVMSAHLLIALSTSIEANNPNNVKQAQQAKQQQALKQKQNIKNLKQNFANLPKSQQKAQIKKVVLPKLRARIANDQKKIKLKDKAIKSENKKLAKAVNQRLRAQQQLESLDREIQDLETATAKGLAGPGAPTQQVAKLNERIATLQDTLKTADASVQLHKTEITKLNGERKAHNDRLVKHLKQKRDGKALISNNTVMPQYEPAVGGSRYQSFAQMRQKAYGQALSPAGNHYMSVQDAVGRSPDAPPSDNYGMLVLRPPKPLPPLPNAGGPAGDQYRALPNVARPAQRGSTQSTDENGNYILMPAAPARVVGQ